MPKDSSRPSLPATSSDFALPSSMASTSQLTIEETNFVFQRFRRGSLLAPKAILHSPLQASFTVSPSPKRKVFSEDSIDDSDVYRERILSDSSPSGSSENPTPPLAPNNSEEDLGNRSSRAKSVSTPPRKFSSSDSESHIRHPKRRLSFPLKQPRIFDIVSSDSRPGDEEVKSEAAFQRLLASGAELPLHPRTPRAPSDRGRYPEEAGTENEPQREDSPSEDEEGDSYFPSYPSSEPITISKRHTPASSVNGDDMTSMSISESPSCTPMDIDVPSGSPSISSTPISQWRYTPPPTSAAMRPNKRKLEDRFDPYPASKRRAVSPSIPYLRDPHATIASPISRTPRLPISIPVAIPASTATSATSSPTFNSSYSFSRSVPMTSSPTLRASVGLASPILRPLGRHRREEEREVEGAGEGVGGLNLGS
ncbi:hypothetical protein VNI00_001813 [Paramarasmius palmivorus]|uniref:Uncharacterized protein n=1 Tax=Paramarasmius palmivorus TaxID=297713 RepID=A0AAW0E4I0_9AGAR